MPSIRLLHCRFKSRIRKRNLTIVIIGVMFMFQPPIFADSVYDLNNYPSQQGRGTLTGSITVLDSAADDGVLVEAEIVKWDFVATNSAFPFPRRIAGSSVDALLGSRVQAFNISIDDDSITIIGSSVDGLDHRLSLIEFSGSGGAQGRLTWRRTPDLQDYFVHVTEHCVQPPDPLIGSPCALDFHQRLWQTSPASLGGDPWVIATRAPHLSDLTRNGFVDFEDLTVLLANWNQEVTAAEGNLVNADTTPVNFEDLTVLLAAWTGPGPAGSPEAALGEAVPEPSTLLLALLATLGLSFYRRRRRRAF